jgi:hypothetical protein
MWEGDLRARGTAEEVSVTFQFRRNWNVHLVLLETSWWAGFNEIYLVRFEFRMWEILIFKWFLQFLEKYLKFLKNLAENSIENSKKPGFGRKNQFEDVVTLGPTAQATLVKYEEHNALLAMLVNFLCQLAYRMFFCSFLTFTFTNLNWRYWFIIISRTISW